MLGSGSGGRRVQKAELVISKIDYERVSALNSLVNTMWKSKFYDEFILSLGLIEKLINLLLNDKCKKVQFCATKALGNISSNADARITIIERGAIPILLTFLSSDNAELVAEAVCVLSNLAAEKPKHQEAIRFAGAFPKIVTLLNHRDETVREFTIKAVGNLASNNIINLSVNQINNAARELVRLLSAKVGNVCINALIAVGDMCDGNAQNQVVFAKEGAIESLINLLRESKSQALWGMAAQSLGKIVDGNAANKVFAMKTSAVHALLRPLKSKAVKFRSQQFAAWTIGLLVEGNHPNLNPSPEAVDHVISVDGVVPSLVSLLSHADPRTKAAAAETIRLLAMADLPETPTATTTTTTTTAAAAAAAADAVPSPSAAALLHQAGAVVALVALLDPTQSHSEGSESLLLDSIQALGCIADGWLAVQEAARLAGAIPLVLQLLADSTTSAEIKNAAAYTLDCLCHGCPESTKDALSVRGVSVLGLLLEDPRTEVRQTCAYSLGRLCYKPTAETVAECNGQPLRALGKLLGDDNDDVRDNAAMALANLVEGGLSLDESMKNRLRELLLDDHAGVRKSAERALLLSHDDPRDDLTEVRASSPLQPDASISPMDYERRHDRNRSSSSRQQPKLFSADFEPSVVVPFQESGRRSSRGTDYFASSITPHNKRKADRLYAEVEVEADGDRRTSLKFDAAAVCPSRDDEDCGGEGFGHSFSHQQPLDSSLVMPDQMSSGSSSSSSSSSYGRRSSTGGNGSSYSSEFQWLHDALAGVKCSEKLQPVIALLREQDILTLKCFSFLTEEDLEGLIGMLSLTAGLKASLRAAHYYESTARRKS